MSASHVPGSRRSVCVARVGFVSSGYIGGGNDGRLMAVAHIATRHGEVIYTGRASAEPLPSGPKRVAVRIAIGVHHFPPRYQGGAEWRVYRTARALRARGHDVRVVAIEHDLGFGTQPTVIDDLFDGVPMRRLGVDVSKLPLRWEYDNTAIGSAVGEFLEEWRADVFHLFGGYLMTGAVIEAAKAAGLPVVLTLTDFWFLCPRITLVRALGDFCHVPADPMACVSCLAQRKRRYRVPNQLTAGWFGLLLQRALRNRFAQTLTATGALTAAIPDRRAYLRRVFALVDRVISPSRFLKALYEREGLRGKHFEYMRQGLDVDHWEPYTRVRHRGRLRIGFAGQIDQHKGVHVLLEAFRQLRGDAEVFLYGDLEHAPEYVRRLRAIAAGNPLVHFLGPYSPAHIGRVLSALDVLVVPSLWYENSPNSILEAFAVGTPVVASRLGGMAELVEDDVNGLTFEAGKAAGLAACLQRLMDAPELLDRYATAISPAKTIVEEIADLERVYASAIAA